MLENPAPGDWLMWRRTLDGWGYSPLDQIDRDNVGDLRMVWTRALATGAQEGTPLAYGGRLYMPNPKDHLQAMDAVTGDLLWEYRRDIPEDVPRIMGGLTDNNRNVAIHGRLIIDTANDDYVYALDAVTGELVWETEIFDYRVHPARHSAGPIVAGGKVISGRSCRPRAGPVSCVIVAHDAATGAELWRAPLVPAPGEPGDETWGGVPYEERMHVGSWMVPSYDPDLNLDLRRDVRHVAGAEVHARRHRQQAPLPQLDAGPRRRHRRAPLVLPAPERPLGPRPSRTSGCWSTPPWRPTRASCRGSTPGCARARCAA